MSSLRCDDVLPPLQVRAVIVDPSCSGSGTRASRMDHLMPSSCGRGEPASSSWTACPDRELPRVRKLSEFQRKVASHAFGFPGAARVVYSTCSVYRCGQGHLQHVQHAQMRVADVAHIGEEWRGEMHWSLILSAALGSTQRDLRSFCCNGYALCRVPPLCCSSTPARAYSKHAAERMTPSDVAAPSDLSRECHTQGGERGGRQGPHTYRTREGLLAGGSAGESHACRKRQGLLCAGESWEASPNKVLTDRAHPGRTQGESGTNCGLGGLH